MAGAVIWFCIALPLGGLILVWLVGDLYPRRRTYKLSAEAARELAGLPPLPTLSSPDWALLEAMREVDVLAPVVVSSSPRDKTAEIEAASKQVNACRGDLCSRCGRRRISTNGRTLCDACMDRGYSWHVVPPAPVDCFEFAGVSFPPPTDTRWRIVGSGGSLLQLGRADVPGDAIYITDYHVEIGDIEIAIGDDVKKYFNIAVVGARERKTAEAIDRLRNVLAKGMVGSNT